MRKFLLYILLLVLWMLFVVISNVEFEKWSILDWSSALVSYITLYIPALKFWEKKFNLNTE